MAVSGGEGERELEPEAWFSSGCKKRTTTHCFHVILPLWMEGLTKAGKANAEGDDLAMEVRMEMKREYRSSGQGGFNMLFHI